MALREAGENEILCNSLSDDLDTWIHHILKCKIKFGKTVLKRTEEFIPVPNQIISNHLVSKYSMKGMNERFDITSDA